MTTASKAKIVLTVGSIVSLMILIILIAAGLILVIGYTLTKSYCGLAIIGSFILSAIILGVYSNKVINKLVQLWEIKI
jgi:carbon starvation protein CstA